MSFPYGSVLFLPDIPGIGLDGEVSPLWHIVLENSVVEVLQVLKNFDEFMLELLDIAHVVVFLDDSSLFMSPGVDYHDRFLEDDFV